jgi:hypothetical protein
LSEEKYVGVKRSRTCGRISRAACNLETSSCTGQVVLDPGEFPINSRLTANFAQAPERAKNLH